jgi:CheY-like chemotaxis protein
MSSSPYLSEQLFDVLQSFRTIDSDSIVRIHSRPDFLSKPRSRSLILNRGEPIYGGLEIPDHLALAREIGHLFKPQSIEAALQVARQKITAPDSIQQIFSLLVRMRVLTWEQIQAFVQARLIWTLEQVLPYPGEIGIESGSSFDLRGDEDGWISWEKVRAEIEQRQQEWSLLTPTIPSMEAIPWVPENRVISVTDAKVAEHLRQWVDGQRSLIEIAECLPTQDPLKMARAYSRWAQMEWVAFRDPKTAEISAPIGEDRDKPTILAVDDSLIVQTLIKRALKDTYNVLLASSAQEALNLLDRQAVKLLLLDVTMPDIDGLEMCRLVRENPKFRELPIIMLTARDGYVDKFKGYMAGSTKYLTKPFKPEELLAVISEYVSSGVLVTAGR